MAARLAPTIPAPVMTTLDEVLNNSMSTERIMAVLTLFCRMCAPSNRNRAIRNAGLLLLRSKPPSGFLRFVPFRPSENWIDRLPLAGCEGKASQPTYLPLSPQTDLIHSTPELPHVSAAVPHHPMSAS